MCSDRKRGNGEVDTINFELLVARLLFPNHF